MESEGFYLTDIGVTFEIKTAEYLSGTDEKAATKSVSVSYGNQALAAGAASGVVEATEKDISDLKKMIPSLFPESRFYHDPFYSRKEADDLYRAWIENSVRGEEADVVLHIPRTGFITCKKVGRRAGKIVLIGVKRGKRGRGLGTALLLGAMKWFAAERVSSVTVRTQLKNVIGMNFYLHCGFLIKEYDLIFAKIM